MSWACKYFMQFDQIYGLDQIRANRYIKRKRISYFISKYSNNDETSKNKKFNYFLESEKKISVNLIEIIFFSRFNKEIQRKKKEKANQR